MVAQCLLRGSAQAAGLGTDDIIERLVAHAGKKTAKVTPVCLYLLVMLQTVQKHDNAAKPAVQALVRLRHAGLSADLLPQSNIVNVPTKVKIAALAVFMGKPHKISSQKRQSPILSQAMGSS